MRPIGLGADKLGGARVTHWVFVSMVLVVCGVIASLPSEGLVVISWVFHFFYGAFCFKWDW